MSFQARILRRAYTGNLSLKTTDHCRTTSLLAKFSPSTTRVFPNGKKLENGLFLCELENVLSPQECAEIIKNGDECIFQDMSDKYRFGKQRNSSRLLALDETLAGNLWQNIEPVLSKEMEEFLISKQPLGFDVSRGEWELHGLNEAMRISKYSGKKKEYFGPHKDAQYCPTGDERSLLTLLVYLNEDFQGGETCFYFPKDVTQSTKGMTTQEEIDGRGGLKKGFDCVKIVPKVAHAVLFSQKILHESLPILKGTKYILKTDVVVKRHSKQFGFAVEKREKEDYLTCLNYFREAQQQELQGNFHDASDLYERALSVRYCYPRALVTASSDPVVNQEKQSECMFLPFVVWRHIFKFLPGLDAENLVGVYPALNVAKKSWEQYQTNNASNLFLDQKFLPKINYHKGVVTRFDFPDADFFRENATGCCRVAAMYSIFLLGHKPEDDVYTVRYNPNTQEVCAVALETLLTDVFYSRRCYGSFYNVRQQDPKMKDPVKDFEASVDRNYMLLRHGAEFVGVELPDSFYAKSTAYPIPGDEIEEVEEEKEEEEEEEEEESKGDQENTDSEEKDGDQNVKIICDGSVPVWADGSSGLYVNDRHRRVDSLISKFIISQNFERDHPFCSYPFDTYDHDPFDQDDDLNAIYEREDVPGNVIYFKGLDRIFASKANVSCTLVSKLKKPITIKRHSVCICFLSDNNNRKCSEMWQHVADSCTSGFYNHLVFDFQTAQLSVKSCGPPPEDIPFEEVTNELLPFQVNTILEEHSMMAGCVGEAMFYDVNIEPLLSSDTSFNHASCQCGNPRFDIHEYCDIRDYPCLNRIRLVVGEVDGKMLVWTVYAGIVAL